MDPPAGEWLYFVAIDKQGHSAFADHRSTSTTRTMRQRPGENGVL